VIWILIIGLYLLVGLGLFCSVEMVEEYRLKLQEFLFVISVCLVAWPILLGIGIIATAKKYLVD